MPNDRRFDEREVGLILKRVAELHGDAGDRQDARSMTRTEIEQVVTELGISKALVTRAASELSLHDVRNRPSWFLGGKTDILFEQSVEGSIDEATLTQMLEVLRRHLGEPGTVDREGVARIWSTPNGTQRRIFFSVVEHADTTTLRLEERMGSAARASVGVGTFTGGFSGFLMVLPLQALVIKSVLLLAMGPLSLAGGTIGWLAGRAWWKRAAKAREDLLRRMFGEIMTLADERRTRQNFCG